ncbi:hypothetical protein UA08_01885 [Talaromyces atroroseus]|uniref:Uncharacterized protein n=1 Tax=Talaromyces atroroseus TaxID=1441469 RepID=A0A1Q5QBJ4_TALAT|nr:hypothetical protein UA08_01885 [Talaromyces atroroseus]OKL63188.1 hypothetical protein UA08_01885 [Talaromyces atroroseus]
MQSRLVLVLLALNAWVAVSLPINIDNSDQAAVIAAPHRTANYGGSIPVMKASSSSSSSSKSGPHFLEWLAESQPGQRNALLRAEALRASHGRARGRNGNWIDDFRRMLRTWSTFYRTQYPTRPLPLPHNHSGMGPPCTVATTAYCPPLSSPHQSRHATSFLEQIQRSLKHIDIIAVCSEYGTELVALSIFFLVPLAVILVEVIDMLHDRWVPEQFPERGRQRVRLTGPERQLRVLEKWEREKAVRDQAQKFWSSTRRGSRNGC